MKSRLLLVVMSIWVVVMTCVVTFGYLVPWTVRHHDRSTTFHDLRFSAAELRATTAELEATVAALDRATSGMLLMLSDPFDPGYPSR